MDAVFEVPITDAEIRLGQFVKLCGLVDSGGEAKARIAAGEVTVNGAVETRRGRALRAGDVVGVGGRLARVAVS
jgi:ribosome-associated protein